MSSSPGEKPLAPGGSPLRRAGAVLRASLQLGLTSFGGPIAHLGYFERVYVRQRHWLSAEQYAGIVALCQVLPGPASSQVGFLVGLKHAGWPGALAAWLGFTLPSALLMYAGALLAARVQGPLAAAALHGLKLLALAVVAQAVASMARRLCPDLPRAAIAVATTALLLSAGGAAMQLAALAASALAGIVWCRHTAQPAAPLAVPVSTPSAWLALALFVLLLAGLPILAAQHPHGLVELADIFYRAGALVFGGGHVVLPLLRDALVPGGWIADERFLTGYGLAQIVPGPLFTLAAYLGAAASYVQPAAAGAIVGVVFIFLPGLLLAVAGAVLYGHAARHAPVRAGLAGINAAVVGLLAAALYDPLWKTAVHGATDFGIAALALLLLAKWRVPPIVVAVVCVALCGIGSLA
jgi:chromate transporter